MTFDSLPASAQQFQAKTERAASEVEPQALVLGDPARGATHFGQSINGVAFQQDPLTSFALWQYLAFYDGARRLCLSRRKLPAGAWQTIRFSGYTFLTNDAHNVVTLGICEADGTLHLTYDGHGVAPTYFRKSRPGVAAKPENFEWNEAVFGPQLNEIQSGKKIHSITYPRFFRSPGGGLQLTYRVGGSGIGDLIMLDYNPKTGQWENTRQIDTRKGEWTDKWGVSPHRSSYANGFDYSPDGKLHTTWTWRENNPVWNRDIAYAYSADKGFTWKNNAGEVISHAVPGAANPLLSAGSRGVVVIPVGREQGMINQQAQAVDGKGRVHVVMWHITPASARAAGMEWPPTKFIVGGKPEARRYHHYWREAGGNWKHTELPWPVGARGWMGFDREDNAYFVFLGPTQPPPAAPLNDPNRFFPSGALMVATATAKSSYGDWSLAYQEMGPFLSEFRADTVRLRNEGVLSIMAQRAAPAGVFWSSLSVVDLKLKPPAIEMAGCP